MRSFFQRQVTISTMLILFAFMWIGQYTCSQAVQILAEQVIYNNEESKLNAINVQDALDENTALIRDGEQRLSKNEGDISGLTARVEQLESRPAGGGSVIYYKRCPWISSNYIDVRQCNNNPPLCNEGHVELGLNNLVTSVSDDSLGASGGYQERICLIP